MAGARASSPRSMGVALQLRGRGRRRHPDHQDAARGLAGNRVARVYGILNGTCNYILTRMETEGRLRRRARRRPSAWATPRPIRPSTSSGIDAAHKLAILTALAFGTPIVFDDDLHRGHRQHHRRRHRVRRRARLSHQAARHRAAHRRRRRAARASDHGADGHRIAAVDGRLNAWPSRAILGEWCWTAPARAPGQPRPRRSAISPTSPGAGACRVRHRGEAARARRKAADARPCRRLLLHG